ncbi:uncharacterized protein LOC125043255 [Penaeus chinensis]|uniref:uncharacterized protein LOC125043255 n=1 Tax=Penaeus chinensis TaxID=139456 RepID=UPI001FB67359|nr:uncharacterized protein LOC125043255 [Penaeus chinensis]
MKPAVSFCFSFLIYLLTCSAYYGAEESLYPKESLCATGLAIPIDKEPRPVAVWAENGNRVAVFGPGVRRRIPTSSEGEWLNFTATQRGSEYCVSSEAFPAGELCDKDRDWLGLRADSETKWNLELASMASGCSQYYLLGLDFDLHDSPTKLLWRPGERAASLRLRLWPIGVLEYVFPLSRKADSQLQYDMTFQRLSGDASCVVTSASLDVSRTCQGNQAGITGFSIGSLDDNGDRTPSYFSLNCEDGGGWHSGTTASSPDGNNSEDGTDQDSDSSMDWEVFLVVVNVIIFILLLETVFL